MLWREEKRTLLQLLFAAMVVGVPLIFLNNDPPFDLTQRYAPMIRELAAGNWKYGFHPRIPPLFPLFGYGFTWIGFSPLRAAYAASVLFYVLTVVPLYSMFRLLYDKRTSVWSCILYICCSRLIRIGADGLRDSMKCFLLVSAAAGFIYFLKHRSWKSSLILSAASAGMVLTRGDSLVFGLLFLFSLFVAESFARQNAQRFCFPLKTVCATVFFLMLLSPWIVYVYSCTGVPVTESRQVHVYNRVVSMFGGNALESKGKYPKLFKGADFPAFESLKSSKTALETVTVVSKKTSGNPPPQVAPAPEKLQVQHIRAVSPAKKQESLWQQIKRDVIKQIYKGLFPYYMIFWLPYIFVCIKKRQWTGIDTVLLMIVFTHTVVSFAQIYAFGSIYISKRYVIMAAPFTFAWTVLGATAFLKVLKEKLLREKGAMTVKILIALFLTEMVRNGVWQYYTPLSEEEKLELQAEKECGDWLLERGREIARSVPPIPRCWYFYSNGRTPVVFGFSSLVPFLAEMEFICSPDKQIESHLSFAEYCRSRNIHYLVWNDTFGENFPEFDISNPPPQFKILFDKWMHTEEPCVIVGFLPHLDRQKVEQLKK